MRRSDKENIIVSLREEIQKSEAAFLTNMVGLTSNDAVRIRKEIREADGKVVVTRNTLFNKAAQGTKYEGLLKGLKGPTAVAFAFKDASAIAKVLHNAGKEFELVTVKAGVLAGQALSAKDVESLAKLPSRDQMLSTLLATFQAPVSAFVRVLDAIRIQKLGPEAGAEASTEAVAEASDESK